MASNSTLDPDNFPVGGRQGGRLKGHDIGSLGPSDSSDTGSDLAGLRPNAEEISFDSAADEEMTGRDANDIDTDRIVGAEEAGLGGGLGEAEEAQFDVQDDARHRRIAEAAYYLAQKRGFAPGHEDDDWRAAERDIESGPKK